MQLDIVAVQTLVKAISLGYLLGAIALSLAALFWRLLGRFTAPAHRANAIFWLIATVFIVNCLLALAVYAAVVSGAMEMTTSLFHRLMHGGWSVTIAIGGAILLGLSLIISWYQWRRGLVSRNQAATEPPSIDGMPPSISGITISSSQAIPTLSLVGAWRPELWINPEYWQTLSIQEQRFALMHELCHRRRQDNQRRLLLEAIAALYFVLPWVRRLPELYEQDCELAVDDYCRQQDGAENYLSLVAKASDLLLPRRGGAVVSNLSTRQLAERLKLLTGPRKNQPALTAGVLITAAILASQVITVLLLAFSVSRCLLTCYLGY